MRVKTLVATAAAALMAASLFATASPASAEAAPQAANEHCAVLIGPSENGEASPVLETVCAPTGARIHSELAAFATHTVSSNDLLITLWEDANYTGSKTNIYGSAGPCDSAGYELHLNTTFPWSWGNRVSSAQGTTECDTADFTTQSNTYARTYNLPTPGLNSTLNDNVGKIHVFKD